MPIDFNPEPQNSDFGYLSQGLGSGLELGLGFQRAKLAAAQNARQQQQMELDQAAKAAQQEQEQQKLKLLEFGQMADLYSKTKNPKLKQQIYLDTIRPAAKVAFGADLPEEHDNSFDEDLDAFGELTQQFSTGKIKDQDFQKRGLSLYANAVKRGEAEAAASIREGLKLADSTKVPGPSSVDTNRTETRIAQFRDRIEKSNPYQSYVTSRNSVGALKLAVEDPGAFGDLGALFDYMRSLDPTSVVREGEQLLFKRTGSLSDRVANALNSYVSGKTLTQDQRNEILKYANGRLSIAERAYQTHTEPTIKQAKRLGLPVEEIDPFYDEFQQRTQVSKIGPVKIPAIATQAEGEWNESKESRYQELLRKRGKK